jgi:hypothetical protein
MIPTRKSNDIPTLAQLDRIQPESMCVKMRLDAVYHPVAFRGSERRGKKLHDSRIGIHTGKRLAIARLPAPQPQPLSLNRIRL